MPRAKKIPKKNPYKDMTGTERLAAIAELLALGIVRLTAREEGAKERDRTGLKAASKHSSNSTQLVDNKGKRHG